jgi:transposase-like protein
MTGIGPVAVRQPRVRGSRGCRWRSRPHSFLTRNSAALHAALEVDRDAAADSLSEGYLDRRFSEALAALLGKDAPGLSPTAIIRLKDGWIGEHDDWQKRDLSAKRYVYVWADGIYLQARLEDEKQCILVLIGATQEGRKELVGFTDGARESAQDWRELLLDLKRRGLNVRPELAIADGALGFWKAAGEVWPTTREQRCWVHKTANVLGKLPKSQ